MAVMKYVGGIQSYLLLCEDHLAYQDVLIVMEAESLLES